MTKLDDTLPRHQALLKFAQQEIAHYHTNNCGRNLPALQAACRAIVTRCLADRSLIILQLTNDRDSMLKALDAIVAFEDNFQRHGSNFQGQAGEMTPRQIAAETLAEIRKRK